MPELLSMNLLMAGMMPTMMALKMRIASAGDPLAPSFWFVMSMALLVGGRTLNDYEYLAKSREITFDHLVCWGEALKAARQKNGTEIGRAA